MVGPPTGRDARSLQLQESAKTAPATVAINVVTSPHDVCSSFCSEGSSSRGGMLAHLFGERSRESRSMRGQAHSNSTLVGMALPALGRSFEAVGRVTGLHRICHGFDPMDEIPFFLGGEF